MGTGKLDVVKKEMERMKINILGVSELKWTGLGHFNSGDHKVYFSGHQTNRYRGIGFILGKEIAKTVLGYNPISDRVLLLRLQGQEINMAIIQVYAPTTAASESEID